MDLIAGLFIGFIIGGILGTKWLGEEIESGTAFFKRRAYRCTPINLERKDQ